MYSVFCYETCKIQKTKEAVQQSVKIIKGLPVFATAFLDSTVPLLMQFSYIFHVLYF